MEATHVQPSGVRTASVFLTISIVCLWIAIPLIAIATVVLFLASYIFNDSGNVPQQTTPLIGGILLFDVALVFLLFWSIRIRRNLAQMLPAARKAMLVVGAVYVAIGLCILPFPFPDPLALVPLGLGIYWLVYFSRATTQAAFAAAPVEHVLPPAV